MKTYIVMAGPDADLPDERSQVIADHFASLAFIVPVIWLLFNRLWLEAAAACLVLVVATLLAETYNQPFITMAISLGLSLLTSLEGRNWRIAALERRGWRMVDVVETDTADTAFEIHAARISAARQSLRAQMPASVPSQSAAQTKPLHPALKPGRATGADTGSIGLVPVERT